MKSSSNLIESFRSQLNEINRQYHKHNRLELATGESGQRLKVTGKTEGSEALTLTGWLKPQEVEEFLKQYQQKHCLDPTRLGRFFLISDDTRIISIDRLKPTRAREKGIRNALKYMREAYHGSRPKRKPISVRPSGEYEDCYDILDGNSTWHVGKRIGMEALPMAIR